MKHWAMGMRILVVVAAAGLMLGCEKNQPPEEATPYNPNVDAPPTNLQINPNPDLLSDQGMQVSARPVAASAAGAAGEAEDANSAAVRAEMGKIIEAAKTGQLPMIAAYAMPKDTDAIKDVAGAVGALTTAEDAMNKAIKTNWGKEPPASLTQILERGPNGGPFLARLGEMSAATLAITQIDPGTIEVKDRGGAKLTFKKSEDKWLISLTDGEVKVYVALTDLANLQAQVAKELTEGISKSEIAEQNADSVIMEKAKTLTDAMKHIKEAMEANQPAAGAGESGSGDAAGGSSGATTAPAADAPAAPAGDTAAPGVDVPAPTVGNE